MSFIFGVETLGGQYPKLPTRVMFSKLSQGTEVVPLDRRGVFSRTYGRLGTGVLFSGPSWK